MKKETFYLVTELELDKEHDMVSEYIGIWTAKNGDDLCSKIENKTGAKITHIEYQTNLLHSLTAYM